MSISVESCGRATEGKEGYLTVSAQKIVWVVMYKLADDNCNPASMNKKKGFILTVCVKHKADIFSYKCVGKHKVYLNIN